MFDARWMLPLDRDRRDDPGRSSRACTNGSWTSPIPLTAGWRAVGACRGGAVGASREVVIVDARGSLFLERLEVDGGRTSSGFEVAPAAGQVTQPYDALLSANDIEVDQRPRARSLPRPCRQRSLGIVSSRQRIALTCSAPMTRMTRIWSRPPYHGYGVPRYFTDSFSMCSTAPSVVICKT